MAGPPVSPGAATLQVLAPRARAPWRVRCTWRPGRPRRPAAPWWRPGGPTDLTTAQGRCSYRLDSANSDLSGPAMPLYLPVWSSFHSSLGTRYVDCSRRPGSSVDSDCYYCVEAASGSGRKRLKTTRWDIAPSASGTLTSSKMTSSGSVPQHPLHGGFRPSHPSWLWRSSSESKP